MHCRVVCQCVLLFVLFGAVSANILRKKLDSSKDNDDVIIITDFKGDSLSGLLQQLRSNSSLRPLSERIEKTIKSSNLQGLQNLNPSFPNQNPYSLQNPYALQTAGPWSSSPYLNSPYRSAGPIKNDKPKSGRFSYKIIDKFNEKLNDKHNGGEKSNKFYDKLTDKGLFFKPYFGFANKFNNKLDNKLDTGEQNRYVNTDGSDSGRNLDQRNHLSNGYLAGNLNTHPDGQLNIQPHPNSLANSLANSLTTSNPTSYPNSYPSSYPYSYPSSHPSNLNHLSNFNEFKSNKPAVTYPQTNYYPLLGGLNPYNSYYGSNYHSNYHPNPNSNPNYNSNANYRPTGYLLADPSKLPYYPKLYFGYKPPDQLANFDQNKYLPARYDQSSFSLPDSSTVPSRENSHDKHPHHSYPVNHNSYPDQTYPTDQSYPADQSTGQSSLSSTSVLESSSNSSDDLDKRNFYGPYKTLYPPSVPFILNNLNNYQATKNRQYLHNLSKLGNPFGRPLNGFPGGPQSQQALGKPKDPMASVEVLNNLGGNSPNQSTAINNEVINSLIGKLNEKKPAKTPTKPFVSSNQLLFNITSEQEIDLLKDKVLTSLLLTTYLNSMSKPKGNASISRSDSPEDDSQGKAVNFAFVGIRRHCVV